MASAAEQNRTAQQSGMRVEHRGEVRDINLEVIPIQGDTPNERYYLVVFEPVKASPAPAPTGSNTTLKTETAADENLRLKQELTEAREYLRAEIQDHEAALEELRAANEEVSSANEELQSANEQLATAKEELQSTNEELTTVNDELKGRNDDLALLSNDLLNVLSSVDVPILMVDRSGRLRRYTPAAGRHFGINASEMGRPLTELTRQFPWPDLEKHVEQAINRLEVTTRELQDEGNRWWALTVRPYRTSDHRIEGAVLTFADIDMLHRHLVAVQEGRDFSDAIVNTVREPLLVLTPEFRVQRGNPAFYRTFRTSAAETEGSLLWEIGNRQWDAPPLRQALEEVLPDNAEFSDLEIHHLFSSLGPRSMRLNARRIVRSDGTAQSILLAIEDITTQRTAEQALLRSNADLERFAYVVSHDLQEPLRSIGTFTELLQIRHQKQPDAEADELMRYVLDGVARMNLLIKDLLAYSRAGLTELSSREAVPAKAALQDALWNLQAATTSAGATVTQDDLPTVQYNRLQLTQVFQNLIGNAVKYRRVDEPLRVYIAVERQDTKWTFSVRDNGIGFEPKEAERIFEVFKRLHGREVEGTGIGLSVCKRIIEHHGGQIWAESQPGVGSTFYFTVPSS